MTKEEIYDKIHDVYESWDGGQIPLDMTSEDLIKEVIQEVINFIPCCTEVCDCEEPNVDSKLFCRKCDKDFR